MRTAIQFFAATGLFWLVGWITMRLDATMLTLVLYLMGGLTGLVGFSFVVSALLSERYVRRR